MQSETTLAEPGRASPAAPAVGERTSPGSPALALAEHAAAGLAWAGADGRLAVANPRFAAPLGLAPEALVGRTLWEVAHADDRAGCRAAVHRLSAGDEASTSLTLRLVDANGHVAPAELTLEAVRDGDGALTGFAITRHEPHGAARRAAERSTRLHELTAALSVTRTPEEVAAAVLRAGRESLGSDGSTMAILAPDGRSLHVVRADGERMPAAGTCFPMDTRDPLTDAVHNGEVVAYRTAAERRARWGGPSPRGFEAAAVVPLLAEGRRLGAWALGFAAPRDFDADELAFLHTLGTQAAGALERSYLYEAERAARRLAEQAVERTARLQAATAALSSAHSAAEVAATALAQGVAALTATAGTVALLDDADGQLTTVASVGFPQAVVEEWASYDTETPTLLSRTARTGQPAFFASMGEVLARFPHVEAAIAGVRAEATAALPFTAGGRVLGVMGLSLPTAHEFSSAERDFLLALAHLGGQALERARLYESERRARAEAEAANRAKADFLAVMSHELRTPLNAIAGYAELMQLGIPEPLPASMHPYLARVQHNQRHLLSLIESVLGFARLEAGKVEFDLRDVPAAALLELVEPMVAPQMAARGLTYLCLPCPPDLAVRADTEKTAQVLINLVGNAVKHTESGGRITLHAEPTEDGVAFHVADTGVGIPADRLQSVFEPFVQVDRRLTRTQEGVGLGLAISRDLALGMGGALTATSRVGEGSVFTLTLPRTMDNG